MTTRSPLWMVTREPLLTELIEYLDRMREAIQQSPHGTHRLEFSRSSLDAVREAFARTIRRGEARLHRLVELLAESFFASKYDMQSVVVGEVESTRERFILSQRLAPGDLYQQTDLDLGHRMLRRLQMFDGTNWHRPTLVANFVEYEPLELHRFGIHRLISRIKAEEELWNKVVDEIFDLDQIVAKDKKLQEFSRFIKDVFGIKIVVSEMENIEPLHLAMGGMCWPDEVLAMHEVPVSDATRCLQIIEVKDYISDSKRSGWKALKSVVQWWDETFEIQIQPIPNFHRERERLTSESHAGFKRSRESIRNQIAQEIPLFGFYQSLLRWLFLRPQQPPPAFPNVTIEVRD